MNRYLYTFYTKLFVIAAVTYVANKGLYYSYGYIPFLHDYLNDLLAMPVILSLALFLMRLIYRNVHYILSKTQVVFAVIYLALVFELILPFLSTNYVGDIIDVICYMAGGFLFYKFGNKPIND